MMQHHTGPTSYYHTDILGSRASVGLRRGQVRVLAGRRYILLHPSGHQGEWVVGYYAHGTTAPCDTRPSEDLRAAWIDGRVRLSIREADAP